MYELGKSVISTAEKTSLSLLTGWFNAHKEGYHCYFEAKNSYTTKGFEIIRTFRKSKEQISQEIEMTKLQQKDVSINLNEIKQKKEVQIYFSLEEELKSLDRKMNKLRDEYWELRRLESKGNCY